jgi:hypothetical protein
LVKPFQISLLTDFERRIYKHLDKRAGGHLVTRSKPVNTEWRDERRQTYQSRFGHQSGHDAGPPDVFAAVISTETQVGTQIRAERVAIQKKSPASAIPQLALDGTRQSGLSRAAQTREPDNQTGLTVSGRPLGGCHSQVVAFRIHV